MLQAPSTILVRENILKSHWVLSLWCTIYLLWVLRVFHSCLLFVMGEDCFLGVCWCSFEIQTQENLLHDRASSRYKVPRNHCITSQNWLHEHLPPFDLSCVESPHLMNSAFLWKPGQRKRSKESGSFCKVSSWLLSETEALEIIRMKITENVHRLQGQYHRLHSILEKYVFLRTRLEPSSLCYGIPSCISQDCSAIFNLLQSVGSYRRQ